MISVNSRLALAIRRANAAYRQVPDPDLIDPFTVEYRRLEGEIDTAMTCGDDLAAYRAIEAWEAHCLDAFKKATR